MTEDELLNEVVRMLNERPALTWCHYRDSRSVMGTAGLPDLIIIGKKVLWRELKTLRGELSTEQVTWKYALTSIGADWDIWNDNDLETGYIEKALNEIMFY